MTAEWTIQSRADRCAATGAEFGDGEYFYTLLFDEKAGFRREDLSEAAFQARPADAPAPFSFWKSKYEVAPPPAPEALGKQTAEDLLRRYLAEDSPQYANVRYILALMLERKRIIKEVEVHTSENGEIMRIYEFAKTGEVLVIPDPQLKLNQLVEVQNEVAGMLQ
ncbi:MAG TPA: hypothetical protein VGO11_05735 [Chthoniobacteraceae bacterium]|jgi:hypothetical protein|nr:hypothetical protein [Chthoniobacteraceae bacterium]